MLVAASTSGPDGWSIVAIVMWSLLTALAHASCSEAPRAEPVVHVASPLPTNGRLYLWMPRSAAPMPPRTWGTFDEQVAMASSPFSARATLELTDAFGEATPIQVEEIFQGGGSWIVVTPEALAPRRDYTLTVRWTTREARHTHSITNFYLLFEDCDQAHPDLVVPFSTGDVPDTRPPRRGLPPRVRVGFSTDYDSARAWAWLTGLRARDDHGFRLFALYDQAPDRSARPLALVAASDLSLVQGGCGGGDHGYPEAGGTRWVAPMDAAGNLGEAWAVELPPP